jgi:protein O-GlcNAc transferase
MNQENSQNRSARLVSVSGAGHSGTTLLASMIGNHPEVHLITHETGWFLDPLGSNKGAELLTKFKDENNRATIIVEKTPRHVHHIDKISEELPETRFLVTLRNPFDLIGSLFTRHQNWEIAVNRVKSDLEAINAIQNHQRVLVVHYEKLIETPIQTIESVCTHIGLRFSSKILDWHLDPPKWFGIEPAPSEGIGEKAHLIRRAWQVQQPLFDGRGRFKRDLNSKQYEEAKQAIGIYAEQWGY